MNLKIRKTYLLFKKQEDGSTDLCVSTGAEWYSVTEANKSLPKEQRREFIIDCIYDGGLLDYMVIEASRERYLEWHRAREKDRREHSKQRQEKEKGQQNQEPAEQKAEKKVRVLSLDAPVSGGNRSINLGSVIPDTWQMEEAICSQAVVESLIAKLSTWQPWAIDMLYFYLAGESRTCTNALAKKYSVSPQMVRKYKKRFENFVKNFLMRFRFDPNFVQ